ncbi:MAG: hypothetical protein ABJM11_01525 [Marinobacter sp.]|uniref:FAD-binding oxidoreductase n=1 Tax=Marinobacter sp. TaxID=50741 RepID=UPI003298EC05
MANPSGTLCGAWTVILYGGGSSVVGGTEPRYEGDWIATRSGGHFATLYTHIDDLVASTRVVTPRGSLESRRLPGSGAGPSPDRLFLGSEGTLGFVTSAWMQLQARPEFRAIPHQLSTDRCSRGYD